MQRSIRRRLCLLLCIAASLGYGCNGSSQRDAEMSTAEKKADLNVRLLEANYKLKQSEANVLDAFQRDSDKLLAQLGDLRKQGKISDPRWLNVQATRSQIQTTLDRMRSAMDRGDYNDRHRQTMQMIELRTELVDAIKLAGGKVPE